MNRYAVVTAAILSMAIHCTGYCDDPIPPKPSSDSPGAADPITAPAPLSPDQEAIVASSVTYSQSFNEGDAKAVAGHYTTTRSTLQSTVLGLKDAMPSRSSFRRSWMRIPVPSYATKLNQSDRSVPALRSKKESV